MVLEWRLSALQTELDGKKPQPSNEQTKKMQQHPPIILPIIYLILNPLLSQELLFFLHFQTA